MTDPIVELAGMLDSGTASGEIMGTAAAASSGGQVQVMVGPNAIAWATGRIVGNPAGQP